MGNDNDYMLTEGNFVCETLYGNNSFKAGIIEIKGDFFQKSLKNYFSSEENFVCSGTHKTIFSGEKRQEIHFDSPASYFNKVIFRNGSEEGIYSNGLFHSLSMERNSTRLHAGCSGTYGWKLAEDEEIEGDLVLLGDTLDLAGHTLTVRGNLIQQNGTISVNGGKLDIKGDYRIQQEEDKAAEVSAASSILLMKKPEDRVCVGGDFVTWSTISHNGFLQQGILEVKGDVEQKKYRKEDNLAMTSESMLRLSGEQKQTVTMDSAGKQRSRLSGIDIQNSQGVELKTDIYVSGNVSDHGNPVSGKNFVIQKETTFTGKSFSGNIKTEDSFTLTELEEIKGNYLNTGNIRMGTDLTVHGDFESLYEFSLGSHRLNTEGNIKIVRVLNVDKGKLFCGSDFELAEDSKIGSVLNMRNQEDYVQIQGNFYAHSRYSSSSMSGGTLEIQGDFEHTSPGYKGNFCASGTHITKFSGEKKQTVRFADDSSYFNHVEIENTNAEGVYGDLSTRGITDGDGLVWLEVNEDEERRFRLTAKCSGHLDYVKEEYKVECGDYMDSIRMVKEGDTSHMYDTNEDYEGDFELKSAILNGTELCRTFSSDEIVKINAYEDDKNTVNLAFNENVTSASIVIVDENENILQVAAKSGLSSNHVTLDFISNTLVEDYRMCVRAVDEKTGSWHMYSLNLVEIVNEKPGRYNKKIAEQCALYSALAYKAVIKEDGKFSDGFSYDTSTDFLSDRRDEEIEPQNKGFVSLEKKLEMDNFIIDNKYMYVNYGEDLDTDGAKDNCSFSIVRRDTVKGGVIYVIIRGTDRVEWYGNMEITGEFYDKDIMDHASFKSAEEQVYELLSEYIRKKKLYNPEIIVTGHSRGAAIANLLAADIIRNKDKHSWKGSDNKEKEAIRAGKVSAYTFATPNVTLHGGTQIEDYNTIFNFCFTDDFVPQVPMEKWEYGKYGNTFPLNSEHYSVSYLGTKYNEYRKRIRSEDKEITYASENTKMLINHISRKWRNVEQYYTVKKPKMTLYEFMHDKVAAAIVEESIFENALPTLSVAVNALYNKESDLYVVARYFLAGSGFFHDYIFDTHNADNYYAAILSGGFDTSSVKDEESVSSGEIKKYLSPAQVNSVSDNVENSSDICQFQRFLRSERNVASGEESVKMPVYELLEWDVENTDTWEGVTIQDGRITAIELPLAVLGGTLDLSGLDKLESLKCLYNGFEDISLEGCSSLKTLLLGGQKIEELDLSGCRSLESVNVSDNHLKKILWGSYSSLKWLNCSANYLDIDTDESLIEVIRSLKDKGIDPAYKYQRYDEKAEYNQQDLDFVRGLMAQGENEVLLGWDQEDLSTWTGIQWKTVAGKNYINRIDIARKELTGSLIATDLKYVREIVCGGNRFKKLDITGCKSLELVNCSAGELEELLLGDNDSLLYLDCLNNQLVVDDIEKECQKIASRTGSEVYYERQYINADRIAFCESECRVLEQFADLDSNKEILKWNLEKPGMIPNIQWKVQDGVYRVKELKIYGDKVEGKLDLSGFEALSRVCLVGTEINQVILPSHMKEIEEGSFVNCRKLESVILPEKIISIGKQAFASCEKLHQIDFPSGLQKIGEEAFANCSNLKKAVFSGDAPQNPGDDIFYGTADDFCIYYEKDSKGWQKAYWLKYRTALLGEGISPTTPEPQEPASSSEPLPTQSPVTTNLPVNTNKPAETEEPESTAKPEPTWKPEETTAPSGVQEPENTKDPEGDSPFQDTDQPPAASIPGELKKQPQLNPETADQSSDWAEGTVSGKKTGYKNMSYKVKKAKVLKFKLKKRKLKVVVRRDKNVTGYEVYYRKGKKGKYKVVRRKGWKNNVILLCKLKKGTFYVKVRAYRKLNGKKYYSKFSKSKKVTVR